MELIFSGYGVEIHKQEERYFLTFDAGGIVDEYKTFEITQDEAMRAQESGEDADRIIIHHRNIEDFGEDYMNR